MTLRTSLARQWRRLTGSPTPPPPGEVARANRRTGADYYYLGPDAAMTRLVDGHILFVDPMDESVSAHLIAHGRWEDWIYKVFCSLLRPGDHVLEVGANLGFYSIATANHVGPDGHLTTLEANPFLARLIQRSIDFNGYRPRTTVIQKAASDTNGVLSFTTSRRNSGGGHLHVADDAFGHDTNVVEVECIRLDDLGLENVRIIRIDAEGAEPLVLRGAEGLLAREDIIVCMEWDTWQMRSRADVPTFVEWLVERGFRFWRITYQATLQPVAPYDLESLPACDLLISRIDLAA